LFVQCNSKLEEAFRQLGEAIANCQLNWIQVYRAKFNLFFCNAAAGAANKIQVKLKLN